MIFVLVRTGAGFAHGRCGLLEVAHQRRATLPLPTEYSEEGVTLSPEQMIHFLGSIESESYILFVHSYGQCSLIRRHKLICVSLCYPLTKSCFHSTY